MKIRDISMELHKGMINYPGNTPFSLDSKSSISSITMGSHSGTHIDSPKHITKRGKTVDRLKLDSFYGPCIVVDASHIPFGKCISAEHLKDSKIKKNDIFLFKTRNSKLKKWRNDFVYLDEDAAEFLVSKKVKSVGVDFLGIQKYGSGYCAAHCVLLKKGIIIFEGLRLAKISQGRYTFAGFPLKITGGDAAPARAVLIR